MFNGPALRPLRHRDFSLLFFAGMVSNIGTWMETVAVGALVVDATGKATWAALAAVAAFLPIGVLSPVGGALADRLPRRPSLLTGYLAATALAGCLTALSATGNATPGAVVLVMFGAGSVLALAFPFQQAILPELVPREELLAAVSLGSAQYNFGRVIGPALAAIVIALGSFTWAFAINTVSFLAVVLALGLMRLDSRPVKSAERLSAAIRDGARVARSVPGCRVATGFIALAALLVSPFIALVPAMADLLTDGGAADLARATGTLVTAQGVGAVLGALALAPVAERIGRRRTQILALVGTPLAILAYVASPSLLVAAATIFVVGAFYIGILSGLATVVQLHAPDAFRGRVVSLFFVALGVVYPLGSILQGTVADAIGLRLTEALGAAAMLAVLAMVALRNPAVFSALDDPLPAPEPVVTPGDAPPLLPAPAP